MKVLIAPDSFKGSLTALQVAQAIDAGIKRVVPDATTTLKPMADGGEGTVQISFTVDADELGEGKWVVNPGFSDTIGIAPHTGWGSAPFEGIYLEYCVRCSSEP